MIPLYEEVRNFDLKGDDQNFGLFYEKFFNAWVESIDIQGQYKLELPVKKDFVKDICNAYNKKKDDCNAALLLNNYLHRRYRLARVLKGRILHSSTLWRFTSGLGAAHPLETGFIWHRTLGVPYLSGSSLKGTLRAWRKYWESDGENEGKVRELFGDTESGQGKLIFFDVLPLFRPKLDLDIMNPHYAPYYSNKEENPPGDYYSPTPIHFLTVAPGQKFEFIVAPAPNCELSESDMNKVVELLEGALSTIGCGAKTAVGYGIFEDKFLDQTGPIFQKLQEEVEQKEFEGLTPFEQRCNRLKKGLGRVDSNKLKEESMELYYQLDNLNETEKIAAAQTLKVVWLELGEWDGRLSEKQVKKVDVIKNVLKGN